MKKILLHPTHRKIIRLLRKHIEQRGAVILTKADREVWEELSCQTQKATERHKSIYRILLSAMRRTEVNKEDWVCGVLFVDFIENAFCTAERKKLFITIRNIILLPILNKVPHLINKQSKSDNK